MLLLPYEILSNELLNDYDLGVCIIISTACGTNEQPCFYMSYKIIACYLSDTFDPSPNQIRKVKESVLNLFDMEILRGEIRDKEFKIIPPPHPELFAVLHNNDVYGILNSKHKNKFTLLRYYSFIMNSMDHKIMIDGKKNVVASHPLSYFADYMHCTINSIINMNKQLEDLHIIYVARSQKIYINETRMTREVNLYGRYEDKKLVDEYAQMLGYEYVKSQISTRSVSQRYNKYVRTGGKDFSSQERDDLIKDVKLYNSLVLPERQKDMSVFFT